MGQEIGESRFGPADFERFETELKAETGILRDWFRDGAFSARDRVGGFELEAWLVDRAGLPAAINEGFLKLLDDPLVVPELARFNIELNTPPRALTGAALARMLAGLEATWRHCRETAARLDAALVMIGILPTVREEQLVLANMSRLKRYRALNEQVFRQRQGQPLALDIVGHETLHVRHQDVMLESATTSFQIHLKVAPDAAARLYNLAQMLSAPMVAVSANSPFLFGHDLWEETRIPVFEQSVAVGGFAGAAGGPLHRVGFGSGYAQHSLLECFEENLSHFPVLLPMRFGPEHADSLPHLRLHNGTIWRWNRPLVGFDDDGTPHLRLEHRVVPSGPTPVDAIANAAFFFGLMAYFRAEGTDPRQVLPFAVARDNFYAAARDGLRARVTWLGEVRGSARELVLALVPLAEAGLERLGIDAADRAAFADILRARAESGRTGAAWQRAWVARHGPDWPGLVHAYRAGQDSGRPVHEWPLDGAQP